MNLIALGDSLMSDCIVRFNIFLASQTHLVQPELLVSDAAGLEFGECIRWREQPVVRSIDTIGSYAFF